MLFLCFLKGISSRTYCVGFNYPVLSAFSNWHERRRCNNVSGRYFRNYFHFFPIFIVSFSVATFSHRRSVRIKRVARSGQWPGVGLLFGPCRPFWWPLLAIFGFTGGVTCDIAGGERVPPAPLCWYFIRPTFISSAPGFLVWVNLSPIHKNYVNFPGIFLFSKYIFQLIGTIICTGLNMYKS